MGKQEGTLEEQVRETDLTETTVRGESQATNSEEPRMADAERRFSPSGKILTTGQIVSGLIVQVDSNGALVDVGTKSEGHIPADEIADSTTEDGKPLQVGDRVSVYVVRPEDEEGTPVLSKKRADYEKVWENIIRAHEQGEILTAMVVDRVKGGLVVDLGMRGFLPASHVRTRNIHALDRFVGQSVKVKIVEVDRRHKRVVVSQKAAVEEERRNRREQTLANLKENQVYKGVVRRIADYGAFVDIGGVDGLLHITEMSWTRINHPSEVLKVGDKIDVMVLRYDQEQNRISLGLRQILPDPWEEVENQFQVGQTVTGTVTRVVPFGAFIRLETGIEGIVPNSELSHNRGQRAQDVLKVGNPVTVKIVSIRRVERRMTLSLRQVEQAQERREFKEYAARRAEESKVTIGDLVGNLFSEAKVQSAADATEAESEVLATREIEQESIAADRDEITEAREQAQSEIRETESEIAAQAAQEESAELAAATFEDEKWSSSELPAESEAEKD